ncbi:Tripartite ATP-independent periplasmic transporter DctQ component [Gloeothece citriformis PCC 7424]|uniref:Tripartite ATP-independent periplasmic transporter DctQ component n=1 Tax=Gloeothece citriformis (strain PCC 7424) TaxID=65393 RepID=B7KGZ6_GLOC7|nr:TRAP transporter small permease subunit [Gloeothece citriformis]ACK73483.1 Tripartite ATP-independent periplasmic transporter DctQ component [Gloeothece citriformis PCC 7424]
MQKLLRIASVIDTINEWIGRLTYWLVLAMVFIGVWNVVGRYLGRFFGQNLTSNGLIEAQWYLFDIVFLLGAAYALKHDDHVRVDIFYKNWGTKGKALTNFIGTFIFLIPFCIMVIYFSWTTIVDSCLIWEMSSDPGGLPRCPIKVMILVSYGLLILQGISEGIKNWAIYTNQLIPQEEIHNNGL